MILELNYIFAKPKLSGIGQKQDICADNGHIYQSVFFFLNQLLIGL